MRVFIEREEPFYCEDSRLCRDRGGYLPCRAVPLDNRLLIQFWSLYTSVLVPCEAYGLVDSVCVFVVWGCEPARLQHAHDWVIELMDLAHLAKVSLDTFVLLV